MKKVLKSGFIIGIANLIIGMGLSWLMNFLSPSLALEYQNPSIFRPWSDPLMSLYFLYPFLLGLILAWIWEKIKPIFKDKDKTKIALNFGLAYFIVAGLPGMFITYSTFQVSLLLVLSWSLTGIIDAIAAGWILSYRK